MGKRMGEVFRGSEIFYNTHMMSNLKEEAIELLETSSPNIKLPDDAFIFIAHQTYIFTLIASW